MPYSRIAGLAGVLFVVLVVAVTVAVGSSSPPDNDATAAEITSYYTSNAGLWTFVSVIAPFVWVCLLVFGSGVFAQVRAHEAAKGEAWAYVGLLGILMQNAIFAPVIATDVAFSVGADSMAANAGLTESIWRFQRAMFTLNGTSLALALTGFSIAALRASFIPRWYAYVGLGGAAFLFVAAVTVTPAVEGTFAAFIGLPGFVLWLVWILTMALRLVREPAPLTAAAPGATIT